MDELGFGSCTNQGECEASCPKEINKKYIPPQPRTPQSSP